MKKAYLVFTMLMLLISTVIVQPYAAIASVTAPATQTEVDTAISEDPLIEVPSEDEEPSEEPSNEQPETLVEPEEQQETSETPTVEQPKEEASEEGATQPEQEAKPLATEKEETSSIKNVKKVTASLDNIKESKLVASSPAWELDDFQHTIRFLQPSGNTWVPVPTPAEQNSSTSSRYGIEYLITLPDTAPRVQPGDTLTITLPTGVTGTGSKPLQMPTGETVANLVANGSTATITFTNNVEKFNKINLNVLVDVRIFTSSQPDNTKKSVTIDKTDYYFNYKSPGNNPNFFTKRGDAVTRDLILWTLFLNYANNSTGVIPQYTNLVITDVLEEQLNLVKIPADRLATNPGNLVPEYVHITCTVSCPPGLAATLTPVTNSVGKVTSFTLTFNQPVPTTQQYYLYYYTNALDNGNAGIYKNNVTFSYDEGTDVNHSVQNTLFGGGATGEQAAVKVSKVNEDDEPINGATFKLEKQNATGTWEEVSTKPIEFGQAFFGGLLIGKYRLTETVFPQNYTIGTYESSITGATQDGASYYFDIVQSDLSTTGKTIDIKATNVLKTADIEILKFDANDNSVPLQGAVFELSNGTNTYTLTTGADGKATQSNIPSGTYTVTEITAPEGYVLNATPQTITLAPGESKQLPIANEKFGSFKLTKTDKEYANQLLEGATFTLSNANNTYTLTTGADGTATVGQIVPGTYTLTETEAPTGYVLSAETVQITVESDEQATYTATNVREVHTLTLTKINEVTGTPLADVSFALERLNEETNEFELYRDAVATDSDGVITFENLPFGQYRVVETSSLPGFYGEYSQEFTVTDDVTVTVENTPFATILITKVDSKTPTKTLPGAQFELHKWDEELNDYVKVSDTIYTSDQNGQITISDLTLGRYLLVEIKAPDGYILGNYDFEFEITAEDLETPAYVIEMDIPNDIIPTEPPLIGDVDDDIGSNDDGSNNDGSNDDNGGGNNQNNEPVTSSGVGLPQTSGEQSPLALVGLILVLGAISLLGRRFFTAQNK